MTHYVLRYRDKKSSGPIASVCVKNTVTAMVLTN